MKKKTVCLLAAACALSVLAACGKKDTGTLPAASAGVENNAPRFKQTERFGTVSTIVLVPLDQAPAKYATYVRQELTELSKDDARKAPDAAYEQYVHTWLKQAASLAKPDWNMIAAITQPEMTVETNAFKKQAYIDKAKADIAVDPSQRNIIYGWQGEIMSITGPDVTTGEYYLTISPNHRSLSLSYENEAHYNYGLFYSPVLDALHMNQDNRGSVQLTVKVPIEKARAIEAMREGTSPMIRVYGHVVGVNDMLVLDKKGAQAGLNIEVEALEWGTRKDGVFKTFFFLDTDQLNRSKP